MQLVRLPDGTSPWLDIQAAAGTLWRSTLLPDIESVTAQLQEHFHNPNLTVSELHTGFNASRRGIVTCNGENITIAFPGSDPNELHKNMWVNAKGPGWWELPYPVYENGGRVHSFFRDMWHGMRQATYDALSSAVADIAARGATPKQIMITGFSMGGGISIIAFTDILERIRHTWGSQSDSPQPWAQDEELRSLVQHITFAAIAAGDMGYYTVLNDLYDKYQIRAWDFMNHRDMTIHSHDGTFRSWRGYRYIFSNAVEQPFAPAFGWAGHNIFGYLQVAEWMAVHGTNQVGTPYTY